MMAMKVLVCMLNINCVKSLNIKDVMKTVKRKGKKNNKKMYTTRLKICTSAKKRTTSTKINSVKTECAAMLTLDQRYDKQIL